MNEQEKTVFGLVVQLDPRIILTRDNQIITEDYTHPTKVAKDLDPTAHPFVVMPTEHWNRFQKLIDELEARDKFRALKCIAILVPKSNVVRGIMSPDYRRFIPEALEQIEAVERENARLEGEVRGLKFKHAEVQYQLASYVADILIDRAARGRFFWEK